MLALAYIDFYLVHMMKTKINIMRLKVEKKICETQKTKLKSFIKKRFNRSFSEKITFFAHIIDIIAH